MDNNTEIKKKEEGRKQSPARLPRFVIAIYALTAICAVLYVGFLRSVAFADFFNDNISPVFRALLAHLTSWIPFSLAEFLLILLPLWVFLICRLVIRKYTNSLKDTLIGIVCIISILGIVFSSFTLTFAAGYRGTSLDKKLGLDMKNVSAQELYDTSLILVDGIKLYSKGVYFETDSFSVMPYSYAELNDKLIDAFDRASEKYNFIKKLDSRLKPVMLSEPMSYTHITGVYTFFTGEANININFPDYCVAFTAAHELAHQRGIAKEDEANFVAFLVCLEANDVYLRYCAYLNLYEYVGSALSKADKDLFYDSYSRLPEVVMDELAAYSEFYEKYEHSTASKVSGAVNNTYLQSQGTPGTKSYGMVVDLAVAYYKK